MGSVSGTGLPPLRSARPPTAEAVPKEDRLGGGLLRERCTPAVTKHGMAEADMVEIARLTGRGEQAEPSAVADNTPPRAARESVAEAVAARLAARPVNPRGKLAP